MAQSFIRKTEDFICSHCGVSVRGNGYTNHCSECLWSQHVDNTPGDRAAGCGGSMRPVGYRVSDGTYDVLHRCEVCKHEKWNKLDRGDNMEVLLTLN